MRTLARLIGYEGELVGEHMIDGCPPRIEVPLMRRLTTRRRVGSLSDPTTTHINIYRAVYDIEFVVEGDPILATYRRRK